MRLRSRFTCDYPFFLITVEIQNAEEGVEHFPRKEKRGALKKIAISSIA